MKKLFMISLALALLTGTAAAQLPPQGYIALFVDEGRSSWCADNATQPYPITMYIFCLPSDEGLICAEFAISYPSSPNLIQSTITPSDSISVTLGTLDAGMSVCTYTCQWDWIWLFNQSIFVMEPGQGYIEIIKHPDPLIPAIQIADCTPGYPAFPAVVFTNLYVNYASGAPECGEPGTRDATWGAIKNMYKE